MYIRVGAIALSLVIAAWAGAQEESADVRLIRTQRAAYNDAIADHDVARLVSYFDDDYQVTASDGSISRGRDMEQETWSAMISSREDLIYVRTPESIEVSRSHPMAAEIGTWSGSWNTPAGQMVLGGRYAAQWRKTDGEWKVRSELFVALYCDGPECPE